MYIDGAIDEIKEEDEYETSSDESSPNRQSTPLKFESLRNPSNNVFKEKKWEPYTSLPVPNKSLIQLKNFSNLQNLSNTRDTSQDAENIHPNITDNTNALNKSLWSSRSSVYESKINEYKSEIHRLLKERKQARQTNNRYD